MSLFQRFGRSLRGEGGPCYSENISLFAPNLSLFRLIGNSTPNPLCMLAFSGRLSA